MMHNDHAAAAGAATAADRPASRLYAWSVFALTFGLMLSDFMSRQVISAIFPFLKSDWALSDTSLGTLVGVVALSVAVFTVPISYIADRWGRVKSITAMAALWSLATIACGLSADYAQLMLARFFVGLGEAAYASAGGALLANVFPARQRATVFGAFLAAGLFGSVAGVVFGCILATHWGWRWDSIWAGLPGLLLAALYLWIVRDYQSVPLVAADAAGGARTTRIGTVVGAVFGARSAIFTYLGSGLQVMLGGIFMAWTPSYLNRYYGMAPDRSAALAGVVVLVAGVGMILGGALSDRLSARRRRNKALAPAVYCLLSALLAVLGFGLPPGPLALALLLGGALFCSAHMGSAATIVTDVTHPGVRSTVMATMILCNNFLGYAPGPVIVGFLSDLFDLRVALTIVPAVSFLAAGFYFLAARSYEQDYERRRERDAQAGIASIADDAKALA